MTQEDDLGLHGASADEELVNRGLGPLILRKVIASILVKDPACQRIMFGPDRRNTLALPPDSAVKPYFQYVVDDPSHLRPGWHIEQSEVAPWFHQPGGQQFRIINECGETGDVAELVRWGYLRRIN